MNRVYCTDCKGVFCIENHKGLATILCPYCGSAKISDGLIDCKDTHCVDCDKNKAAQCETGGWNLEHKLTIEHDATDEDGLVSGLRALLTQYCEGGKFNLKRFSVKTAEKR